MPTTTIVIKYFTCRKIEQNTLCKYTTKCSMCHVKTHSSKHNMCVVQRHIHQNTTCALCKGTLIKTQHVRCSKERHINQNTIHVCALCKDTCRNIDIPIYSCMYILCYSKDFIFCNPNPDKCFNQKLLILYKILLDALNAGELFILSTLDYIQCIAT